MPTLTASETVAFQLGHPRTLPHLTPCLTLAYFHSCTDPVLILHLSLLHFTEAKMPSAPYAPLPTQPTQEDADRDLQDAFGDDDDDDLLQSTRLINQNHQPGGDPPSHGNRPQPIQIPGTYDFERDYDYTMPPPGSPPEPSATALPNEHGNTNGFIPTSPVTTPFRSGQSTGRFSGFFRKAVGSILPTHYQSLPTESPTTRVVGGGIQNDGVFANVMAKPVRSAPTVNDDGSIFLAPETVQSQAPPVRLHPRMPLFQPYPAVNKLI